MAGETTRPLIAAMAGTTTGFVAAIILSPRLLDQSPGPEQLALVAAACGGLGGLAGSLFAAMFSTRLTAYWFWFLAALAAAGFAPYPLAKLGETWASVWSEWARLDVLAILLHVLLATVAAIVATTLQSLATRGRMGGAGARQFGTAALLGGAVVLGGIAFFLHWIGTSPALLLAVISPLAGKQATMLLLRLLQKSAPAAAPAETAPPQPSRRQRWRNSPQPRS